MTSLFAESLNMVAILEKSDAAGGFEQTIDFLSGSYIHHALTVNPHMYISWVETPLFETMLVVRDIAKEAEAQIPAQDDDVQEHAEEEVATDVVSPTPTSPSPSSPVISSSPPHQSPSPPQPQAAEGSSHLVQQLG
nr:hypothetical protein [Tanacetum cinerariifolium]